MKKSKSNPDNSTNSDLAEENSKDPKKEKIFIPKDFPKLSDVRHVRESRKSNLEKHIPSSEKLSNIPLSNPKDHSLGNRPIKNNDPVNDSTFPKYDNKMDQNSLTNGNTQITERDKSETTRIDNKVSYCEKKSNISMAVNKVVRSEKKPNVVHPIGKDDLSKEISKIARSTKNNSKIHSNSSNDPKTSIKKPRKCSGTYSSLDKKTTDNDNDNMAHTSQILPYTKNIVNSVQESYISRPVTSNKRHENSKTDEDKIGPMNNLVNTQVLEISSKHQPNDDTRLTSLKPIILPGEKSITTNLETKETSQAVLIKEKPTKHSKPPQVKDGVNQMNPAVSARATTSEDRKCSKDKKTQDRKKKINLSPLKGAAPLVDPHSRTRRPESSQPPRRVFLTQDGVTADRNKRKDSTPSANVDHNSDKLHNLPIFRGNNNRMESNMSVSPFQNSNKHSSTQARPKFDELKSVPPKTNNAQGFLEVKNNRNLSENGNNDVIIEKKHESERKTKRLLHFSKTKASASSINCTVPEKTMDSGLNTNNPEEVLRNPKMNNSTTISQQQMRSTSTNSLAKPLAETKSFKDQDNKYKTSRKTTEVPGILPRANLTMKDSDQQEIQPMEIDTRTNSCAIDKEAVSKQAAYSSKQRNQTKTIHMSNLKTDKQSNLNKFYAHASNEPERETNSGNLSEGKQLTNKRFRSENSLQDIPALCKGNEVPVSRCKPQSSPKGTKKDPEENRMNPSGTNRLEGSVNSKRTQPAISSKKTDASMEDVQELNNSTRPVSQTPYKLNSCEKPSPETTKLGFHQNLSHSVDTITGTQRRKETVNKDRTNRNSDQRAISGSVNKPNLPEAIESGERIMHNTSPDEQDRMDKTPAQPDLKSRLRGPPVVAGTPNLPGIDGYEDPSDTSDADWKPTAGEGDRRGAVEARASSRGRRSIARERNGRPKHEDTEIQPNTTNEKGNVVDRNRRKTTSRGSQRGKRKQSDTGKGISKKRKGEHVGASGKVEGKSEPKVQPAECIPGRPVNPIPVDENDVEDTVFYLIGEDPNCTVVQQPQCLNPILEDPNLLLKEVEEIEKVQRDTGSGTGARPGQNRSHTNPNNRTRRKNMQDTHTVQRRGRGGNAIRRRGEDGTSPSPQQVSQLPAVKRRKTAGGTQVGLRLNTKNENEVTPAGPSNRPPRLRGNVTSQDEEEQNEVGQGSMEAAVHSNNEGFENDHADSNNQVANPMPSNQTSQTPAPEVGLDERTNVADNFTLGNTIFEERRAPPLDINVTRGTGDGIATQPLAQRNIERNAVNNSRGQLRTANRPQSMTAGRSLSQELEVLQTQQPAPLRSESNLMRLSENNGRSENRLFEVPHHDAFRNRDFPPRNNQGSYATAVASRQPTYLEPQQQIMTTHNPNATSSRLQQPSHVFQGSLNGQQVPGTNLPLPRPLIERNNVGAFRNVSNERYHMDPGASRTSRDVAERNDLNIPLDRGNHLGRENVNHPIPNYSYQALPRQNTPHMTHSIHPQENTPTPQYAQYTTLPPLQEHWGQQFQGAVPMLNMSPWNNTQDQQYGNQIDAGNQGVRWNSYGNAESRMTRADGYHEYMRSPQYRDSRNREPYHSPTGDLGYASLRPGVMESERHYTPSRYQPNVHPGQGIQLNSNYFPNGNSTYPVASYYEAGPSNNHGGMMQHRGYSTNDQNNFTTGANMGAQQQWMEEDAILPSYANDMGSRQGVERSIQREQNASTTPRLEVGVPNPSTGRVNNTRDINEARAPPQTMMPSRSNRRMEARQQSPSHRPIDQTTNERVNTQQPRRSRRLLLQNLGNNENQNNNHTQRRSTFSHEIPASQERDVIVMPNNRSQRGEPAQSSTRRQNNENESPTELGEPVVLAAEIITFVAFRDKFRVSEGPKSKTTDAFTEWTLERARDVLYTAIVSYQVFETPISCMNRLQETGFSRETTLEWLNATSDQEYFPCMETAWKLHLDPEFECKDQFELATSVLVRIGVIIRMLHRRALELADDQGTYSTDLWLDLIAQGVVAELERL